MAMMGFKGFGWILGLATVSPACYMVSSMVAAERSRVEAVERAIISAQQDIRALDTEFDTRANFTQLERWNGDVLALAAPRPEQFVASDTALAGLRPITGEARYASLVVPSVAPEVAAPQPVALVAAAAAPVPAPAAAPVAPRVVAALSAPAAVVAATSGIRNAVAKGRAQTVAMLDDRLLSDATLGDLVSGARRETVKLR